MEEIKTKNEIHSFVNKCGVCLSTGRKLFKLGRYKSIFTNIITDINFKKEMNIDNIELCWECIAILKKVYLMHQHLKWVNEIVLRNEFPYGSLSNLKTVLINDTQIRTVYVCDSNTEIDIKVEQITEESDTFVQSNNVVQRDSFVQSDNFVDCNDDLNYDDAAKEIKEEIKKPKSSLWTTNRTLQNKKPKFKIVTDYIGRRFNKKQIKNDELLNYLNCRRQSEYFLSKKFKCEKCILVFVNENSLLNHNIKYHNKVTQYICDICGSYILNKRHLSLHIRKHYNKYVCNLCDYVCTDNKEKIWHYKKKHNKIFECILCSLPFGSRNEFYKHYKQCHEKFICDHCGVSFKMKYCIENHIRKQHRPFECKPCNKRFARYNGLWLHNKLNHSLIQNKAYCVECDRSYKDEYRYKWHLANSVRHTKKVKKSIPCPECGKIFTKTIYMKDHYNLVHLKFYKHRCEECDKNFIRNADLVKHTRKVHQGIQPPRNKPCYLCGRSFTTNRILRNHIATHTRERAHACADCGATFAQGTTLTAHQRAIHTSTRKQT